MSDTIILAIAALMMVMQVDRVNRNGDYSSSTDIFSSIFSTPKTAIPTDVALVAEGNGMETISPQPVGTAMLAVLGTTTNNTEFTHQD